MINTPASAEPALIVDWSFGVLRVAMAGLSLALLSHQLPALRPGLPFSLSITGAASLQHTIAYAFVQQELSSAVDRRVSGTPNHILTALIKALSAGGSQTYTLAIFKRHGQGRTRDHPLCGRG